MLQPEEAEQLRRKLDNAEADERTRHRGAMQNIEAERLVLYAQCPHRWNMRGGDEYDRYDICSLCYKKNC